MKLRSSNIAIGFAILAVVLGSVFFGRLRIIQAASDDVEPKKVAPDKKPNYLGYTGCLPCHESGNPKYSDSLCQLTELTQWKANDKHIMAMEVLTQPRARKMGEALGYDVSKAPQCVSCHGVNGEDKNFDSTFGNRGNDKISLDEAKIREGVTCTVCHGSRSDWVKEHAAITDADRKKWIQYSREEKEKKFGMTDLWDPAKRSKLCLSCHQGNTEEGKFVTHAMYAAGHPPLPGVELSTFSEQMPRHWQYLAEKKPEVQKLLNVDSTDASLEKTRLVLTSGLVSFRDSLRLLAEQAGEAAKATTDEAAWPELAQFDCYACHHDLKLPAWRQSRLPRGKPGRPQMREWPTALLDASLEFLGDKRGAATEQLKALVHEFDATPFGDADKVSAIARNIAKWTDERVNTLTAKKNAPGETEIYSKPLDHAAALEILRKLATLAPGDTPDYDSARQIAWAIRTIYNELFAKAAKPQGYEEVQLQFAELQKQLKLNLPAGRKQTIVEQLSDQMKVIGDYNPELFKKTLADILKLLPEKP